MATDAEARALNAEVAHRVMGFHGAAVGGWADPRVMPDGRVLPGLTPKPYTTDPTYDYKVLHHVRETWDHAARFRFGRALVALWSDRAHMGGAPAMRYRVGDWSRAAPAALNEGEG